MTTGIKILTALTVGFVLAGPVLAYYEPANHPQGRWERKTGKTQVSLTMTGDRLHVTMTGERSFVLHADYSMTRDGILFGVFTSVDSEDEDVSEELVDNPFSFRFRVDEGTLIIRDFRSTTGSGDKKDNPLVGRFKLVPGSATPTTSCAPPAPPVYPPAPVVLPSYAPAPVQTYSVPPPAPPAVNTSYKTPRPARHPRPR